MKPHLKTIGVLSLALVAVVSIAGNAVLYRRWQTLKTNPQVVAEAESAAIVEAVGKLMVLPDEKPTVATVSDLSKLKGQPFFEHAKVGDKVLMFTIAKKAVLYDPVGNKLVEVAPLNDQGASEADVTAKEETDAAADAAPTTATKKKPTNVNAAP